MVPFYMAQEGIWTGIALRKLGADVRVVGKVGQDGFGDFVLKELKKAGMITSTGHRRFLHTLGANGTFCLEDVDLTALDGARLLHIAGTFRRRTDR